MAWEKDPRRVAINQHMHRFHDGAALAGDTSSRYVQHELLHNDGKEWVARGKPLHRHDIGSDGIPSLEPVLVESAE